MKAVKGLVLGCVALLLFAGPALADAKDDAAKALVGKWEMKKKMGDVELKGVLSFEKDGKLSMKMDFGGMNITAEGKYKLIDGKTLEVTLTFMGKTKTDKSKFKISGDTLELIDPNGKAEKFTRVKK